MRMLLLFAEIASSLLPLNRSASRERSIASLLGRAGSAAASERWPFWWK